VLHTSHRLRRSADFARAIRRGRRAGRETVVVHLLVTDPLSDQPARVGFVVSRAVGPAVTRNRVKRRLRHVMRDRLDQLGAGTTCVVRALPAAADADFHRLQRDVDDALAGLATGARR
jgi:ribonuclease P protein component